MDTLFNWLFQRISDLFFWLFQHISALGETVIEGVLSAASNYGLRFDTGPVESYLAAINVVFPLYETIGWATALFGLWVICATYRIIKQYIPTIAS